CAVKIPQHMAAREPKPCPYSSVFVRISPYYSARTLCIAQCALPASPPPFLSQRKTDYCGKKRREVLYYIPEKEVVS
ncbi:MAG: hypothetical protein IKZ31_07295, partial [Lentisphaeria bacterium]|nr:hypothetical protein [Lentisphaeria bacterium]